MAEYKMCDNSEMAIYILEFIKRNYEKHSDQAGVQKYIEALQMGIDALEKQIPKKPKKKEESQYSIFYDCPCCGGYLVSKIDGELCGGQKFKYCYRCGQALDWNDHPTEKGGDKE